MLDSKQFKAYKDQELAKDEEFLRKVFNDPKERFEYIGNTSVLVIPGSKAHQLMKEAGFTFTEKNYFIRVITQFERDEYAALGPNATGLDKYKTLWTSCICNAGPTIGYHNFCDYPHTIWGIVEKLHKREEDFTDMMLEGGPIRRVVAREKVIEAFPPGLEPIVSVNRDLLTILAADDMMANTY